MFILLILIFFGYPTIILGQKIDQVDKPLEIPCDQKMCDGPLSTIYCHGQILHLTWKFGLQDTCPGNRMKFNAPQVLQNFERLEYPVNRTSFESFCNENFENVELTEEIRVSPSRDLLFYVMYIYNPKHKKLAIEINERWNCMARRYKKDVLENPHRYPVWSVPFEFIVPGGRFDTYYYWDSYWIILGLARSQMLDASYGMLQNFIILIEEHGYVPNSGHIGMTKRSQPPMFTHMINAHYQASEHIKRDWLKIAAKELTYWENHRTIIIGNETMFIYDAQTNCPRPENFLEDYYRGINSTDPKAVWKGIATACESGWDFSSRWMSNETTKMIRADRIIPVDLNVIMAKNYYILNELYQLYGFQDLAKKYFDKYEALSKSIHTIFWNSKENSWFDYNLDTKSLSKNFYVSNFFPLLLPALNQYANKTIKPIRRVTSYPGGVPTSLIKSDEQWDYPNVWAPTNHLFIQSLRASKNSVLEKIAKEQALKFIDTVYNGVFKPPKGKNGSIWEKYNAVTSRGIPGTGGEYEVQKGFGWTNGAVIDLTWQFRNEYPKPKNLLEKTHVEPAPLIPNNVMFFIICAPIVLFFVLLFSLPDFTYSNNANRVHVQNNNIPYTRM